MSISPLQVQYDAVFTYLHLARRQTQHCEGKAEIKREGEEDKQMAFIMTQLKVSFLLLATEKDWFLCVCVSVCMLQYTMRCDFIAPSVSSKGTG